MNFCRICHSSLKPEINIFKENIGVPPVPIIDVLNACLPDLSHDSKDKTQLCYICMKCSGKLLIYYKASVIMKKIQIDLNTLVDEAPSLNVVDEKEEITVEYLNLSNTQEEDFECSADQIEFNDEDCIKVEYILESSDEAIENVEEEFVLVDEMTDVIKTELLNVKTNTNDDSCMLGEKIEIEALEEYSENIPNSRNQNKKLNVTDSERSQSSEKLLNSKRQPITCMDCDIVFTTKRKYAAHRRDEHFAGFICDQCGRVFHSYSGLVTHKLTHKPVKEFVCPVCGEGYHHKGYLQRHMAWHSGETPFQCDLCPKSFVHKVALYKHKKVHENVRNITCSECDFKFRTKAHLNRHMSTHTGAKPHSCPICGKCFSQVYNMKVHIKEHEAPGSTRRSRMKCKSCSKMFTNNTKYEEHRKHGQCQPLA